MKPVAGQCVYTPLNFACDPLHRDRLGRRGRQLSDPGGLPDEPKTSR